MITKNRRTDKSFQRSTSKQIKHKDRSRSVTKATAGAAERSSKSHERVRPWLELANLLPPPPSDDELRQTPNVLTALPCIWEWQAKLRTITPAEFVRRFERSHLVKEKAITASLDLQLLHSRVDEAERFLELVREIANTLRPLVAAASPKVLQAAGRVPLMIRQLYGAPTTSRSEAWIRNGAVATCWVDPFQQFLLAIEGVEATRLRQCPVCKHFFFALRKDQKACSKPCNAVRRVRDWRANQAQHEYRRKLKGAGFRRQ